jgi:2-methylisocitrate lyase-like PEP mutase family enzyme
VTFTNSHHGTTGSSQPGCYDALSAKIIERWGLKQSDSGFGVAGSRLGKPDVDYSRFRTRPQLERARRLIPVTDVDTGEEMPSMPPG